MGECIMLTVESTISAEPALRHNINLEDLYSQRYIKVSNYPYTRNEWEDDHPLWCHNFRLIAYGDDIGDFEHFVKVNKGNLVLIDQIINRELIPYEWQGKLILAVK
jgi:hypothetical protein